MTVYRVRDSVCPCELVVDPDIPGQIGWEELLAMARLAHTVPANGRIVEVGALYGRSTFTWAMNAPDAWVFSIDPWERKQWIIDLVEGPQSAPPFSGDAHRDFTRECSNIFRLKGKSPETVKGWTWPIDVYFEDGDHSAEAIASNFGFWEPLVKPGGIICGDEYHPDFPDMIAKVEEYAVRWQTKAHVVGNFWWLRKPYPPILHWTLSPTRIQVPPRCLHPSCFHPRPRLVTT